MGRLMSGSPDPLAALGWTLQDWRGTNNDTKKELICLISSITWEGDNKIHAARALAWAYKTTPVDNFKKYEEFYWKEYAKVLSRWLKICVSTRSEVDFIFKTCVLPGKDKNQNILLDREKCIINVISRGDDLDPFFFPQGKNVLDKEGELYLRFLITWFIRRYDLKTSLWLIRKLAQHRPKRDDKTAGSDKQSDGWGWRRSLYFLSIYLAAILPFLCYFLLHPFFPEWAGNAAKQPLSLPTLVLNYWYPLIILSALGILICCYFLIHYKYSTAMLQLLIPRLGACILVGYFPLLITDEIWCAVPHLTAWRTWWPPPPSFAIIVLALMSSFFYLLIEIKNKVQDRQTAWRRTVDIFLIGLGWSFIIGLISLNLMGPAFKNRLESLHTLLWAPGLGGEIPVQVLLLYMPLALLIGIFLQIIWEEKPITEPL